MDRTLLDVGSATAAAAAEPPASASAKASADAAAAELAALDPFPDLSEAEVLALMEAVERGAADGAQPVPEDLRELLRNAKRARGEAVEQDPSTELVTPRPGWVIKTTDRATGKKVFINVCTSDRIPAPGAWANGSLPPEEVEAALAAALADSGDSGDAAAEALRFPLSVGSARPDTDKAGAPCATVDAVVADAVAAAAAGHRPFKAFLIDLVLCHVGAKHKLDLDPQYKLPKMAYKGPPGGPEPQRVRREPRALVTEVGAGAAGGAKGSGGGGKASGSRGKGSKQGAAAVTATKEGATPAAAAPAAAAASKTATAAAAAAPVLPPADLTYALQFEGRPVTGARLVVPLPPSCRAAGDVRAEVAGRRVTVTVTGGGGQQQQPPPLRVELPFAVDAAAATATLVRPPPPAAAAAAAASTAAPLPAAAASAAAPPVLEVALPYRPLREYAAELVAAAPRAFGASLPAASADAYLELS